MKLHTLEILMVLSASARTCVCILYMCDAGWAVQLITSVFYLDGKHPTVPCRHSGCVCVCARVRPPPAAAHVLESLATMAKIT